MSLDLEQPNPQVPNPNPLEQKEEEEQEHPTEENEEEQQQEEEKPSGKSSSDKKRPFQSNRISVTMYGIISGENKCEICIAAHKFFSDPKNFKFFTYKHVSLTTEKGMNIAKRRGMSEMPFFRVRRKGETSDEWIQGFNGQEWEDMKNQHGTR